MAKKELSAAESEKLLKILKERFEKNMNRHTGLSWEKVLAKLKKSHEKFWSIAQMENTGGEPDVISYNKKTEEYAFVDSSTESPAGRRSVCYDLKALNYRKENKPKSDALSIAQEMGIEILNEEDYRELQGLGEFDLKTSSWIKTPEEVRKLGGALFCDRRYGKVFVYHNGAESYYAARGFRGKILV